MVESVVITGANGWIGGKLAAHLKDLGWEVIGVSRTPDQARGKLPDVDWVGVDGALDDAVRETGMVVNLAGRGLLEQPWDEAYKRAMYESRVDLTRRIVKALAASRAPEKVLVSASGYPVYGDAGEAVVSEEHPVSHDAFSAALDADWESAAREAEQAGARVALMRIGVVFGADGGALPVLKQPFDQGGGVVLGDGAQWLAWVHIDDAVGMLAEALVDSSYNGPINVVAPNPVRHRDFVQTLAEVMDVPVTATVPAAGVTGQLGEAAELVLMSVRCVPRRAEALGYAFKYPDLDGALRALV